MLHNPIRHLATHMGMTVARFDTVMRRPCAWHMLGYSPLDIDAFEKLRLIAATAPRFEPVPGKPPSQWPDTGVTGWQLISLDNRAPNPIGDPALLVAPFDYTVRDMSNLRKTYAPSQQIADRARLRDTTSSAPLIQLAYRLADGLPFVQLNNRWLPAAHVLANPSLPPLVDIDHTSVFLDDARRMLNMAYLRRRYMLLDQDHPPVGRWPIPRHLVDVRRADRWLRHDDSSWLAPEARAVGLDFSYLPLGATPLRVYEDSDTHIPWMLTCSWTDGSLDMAETRRLARLAQLSRTLMPVPGGPRVPARMTRPRSAGCAQSPGSAPGSVVVRNNAEREARPDTTARRGPRCEPCADA